MLFVFSNIGIIIAKGNANKNIAQNIRKNKIKIFITKSLIMKMGLRKSYPHIP